MTRELANRVAVVTGGGGGLGRAIAVELAAAGASVMVNDVGSSTVEGRQISLADAAVDEIQAKGGTALANYDSVATADGARSVVTAALGWSGQIDILATCAGNTSRAPFLEFTEPQWDSIMDLHLNGQFFCIQAAAEGMCDRRFGRIVTFTSHVGLYGLPNSPAYSTAKAGVIGLTKSAALAFESFGVTVNAIAPSAVTPMSSHIFPVDVLESRLIARGRPLPPADMEAEERKRELLGDPRAIGAFVRFLSGQENGDITGQIFSVMGGHIGIFQSWTEASSIDKKVGIWEYHELPSAYREVLSSSLVNINERETKDHLRANERLYGHS